MPEIESEADFHKLGTPLGYFVSLTDEAPSGDPWQDEEARKRADLDKLVASNYRYLKNRVPKPRPVDMSYIRWLSWKSEMRVFGRILDITPPNETYHLL